MMLHAAEAEQIAWFTSQNSLTTIWQHSAGNTRICGLSWTLAAVWSLERKRYQKPALTIVTCYSLDRHSKRKWVLPLLILFNGLSAHQCNRHKIELPFHPPNCFGPARTSVYIYKRIHSMLKWEFKKCQESFQTLMRIHNHYSTISQQWKCPKGHPTLSAPKVNVLYQRHSVWEGGSEQKCTAICYKYIFTGITTPWITTGKGQMLSPFLLPSSKNTQIQ